MIENKDFQTIIMGILMAGFGGIVAFLQNHEGKGLQPADFFKAIIAKILIATFTGMVAGFLCKTLHLGFWETAMVCSMSGFANKEALDWLKARMQKRIES